MKRFPVRVPELDLHALTADEAISQLATFLHNAYSAGAPQALVVHGKGTGVLRTEVRRYLAQHPLVFHYGEADRFHGGTGATQVIFKY
ncbi:MAG: Smr/MutS family protein [Dehalococcoidia bacterium]|nr:Smr/MutS family protein [Dehalococcoidia bacterium]